MLASRAGAEPLSIAAALQYNVPLACVNSWAKGSKRLPHEETEQVGECHCALVMAVILPQQHIAIQHIRESEA